MGYLETFKIFQVKTGFLKKTAQNSQMCKQLLHGWIGKHDNNICFTTHKNNAMQRN